jgi:hypothetical protein
MTDENVEGGSGTNVSNGNDIEILKIWTIFYSHLYHVCLLELKMVDFDLSFLYAT